VELLPDGGAPGERRGVLFNMVGDERTGAAA
jgi:hypothetical protein